MTPNDRKYTKEHEWLMETSEGIKAGITDHAQHALGDIVFVELPAEGDEVEKGGSFAVVESIKAVSNVYTPIGGKVIAVNNALEDAPELLNEAPYENHIAIFADCEMEGAELLSAEQYDAYVSEEG